MSGRVSNRPPSEATLRRLAGGSGTLRVPGNPPRLTGEVFGAAPRELVRAVPLRHTVDLIKTTVEVLDENVDSVAERAEAEALRIAVLVFSRELAFATAHVYASFAENRGAWD